MIDEHLNVHIGQCPLIYLSALQWKGVVVFECALPLMFYKLLHFLEEIWKQIKINISKSNKTHIWWVQKLTNLSHPIDWKI